MRTLKIMGKDLFLYAWLVFNFPMLIILGLIGFFDTDRSEFDMFAVSFLSVIFYSIIGFLWGG